MGLSSKQVSGDTLGWSQDLLRNGGLEIPKPPSQARTQQQQQQRQQMPPVRCPRCDSTNTKFCYYNNYSRTQPRHFCKVCRRHWTNGGTLRNVPVGGTRKNKRTKTTHQPTTTNSTSSNIINTSSSNITDSYSNYNMIIQQQQLPESTGADHNSSISFPDILRRALLHPVMPSDYKDSLPSLPPLPLQFATSSTAISYDDIIINPFSDMPSSTCSPSIDGSTTSTWQMLQALPASTGANSILDASSIYWSGWDDDITGLVSSELIEPTSGEPARHP